MRSLSRRPAVLAVVSSIIAVGVGANFMLVASLDQILWRPVEGITDARQVRRVVADVRDASGTVRATGTFSAPILRRLESELGLEMAASAASLVKLPESDVSVQRAWVSGGYFDVLGAEMALGSIAPFRESGEGGRADIAVLSDALWMSLFAGDLGVVGKTITLEGVTYTVVAVASPRFTGIELEPDDIWVPMDGRPAGGEGDWRENREAHWLSFICRLHDQKDARAVEARATRAMDRVLEGSKDGSHVVVVRFEDLSRSKGSLGIGRRKGAAVDLVARLSILSVVILLLSVASASTLLVLRQLRRRREVAVQLALGATRMFLVAVQILEAVPIALLAVCGAETIALVTDRAVRVTAFAATRLAPGGLDARAFALCAAVTAVAVLFASVAPCILSTQVPLTMVIRESGGVASTGRGIRSWLLVFQVGVCMLLLPIAVAFGESLWKMTRIERGFEADRLLSVNTNGVGDDVAGVAQLARDLRLIPGVQLVGGGALEGLTGAAPLGEAELAERAFEGAQKPPHVWFSEVDRNFIDAAGLQLISGHGFSEADERGEESRVVITESLASRSTEPGGILGRCLFSRVGRLPCGRVIGIVRDIKWSLRDTVSAGVLALQAPSASTLVGGLVVRMATLPTAQQLRSIRSLVRSDLAERGTIERVDVISDKLRLDSGFDRLASLVTSAFGGLALFAVGVGIAGLVGADVSSRRHELGIRRALGSPARSLIAVVLRDLWWLLAVGAVLGLVLAKLAGGLLVSYLYDATPVSAFGIGISVTLLACVGALASAVPISVVLRAPIRDLLAGD